jgi:hypothetical protein
MNIPAFLKFSASGKVRFKHKVFMPGGNNVRNAPGGYGASETNEAGESLMQAPQRFIVIEGWETIKDDPKKVEFVCGYIQKAYVEKGVLPEGDYLVTDTGVIIIDKEGKWQVGPFAEQGAQGDEVQYLNDNAGDFGGEVGDRVQTVPDTGVRKQPKGNHPIGEEQHGGYGGVS